MPNDSGQLQLGLAPANAGAQQRLQHFEDCASAIDHLFALAYAAEGAAAFDTFLDFIVRFNNLSVYNAMLVRVQRPGASAVGSRAQWARVGRTVAPDAIPVVVLQPFGPVRFLYEYLDTYGKPLPGERDSVLFADGSLAREQYAWTIEKAKQYRIKIEETDGYGSLLAGTAAGLRHLPSRLSPVAGTDPMFRIRLNARHDRPTRFATLAHELGHIYCGHVGAEPKGAWPARTHLTHEQCELEAEAVAWLVCQRTGVQPRSRDYLRSFICPEHLEGVSMYAIFEAANRVEARTRSAGGVAVG